MISILKGIGLAILFILAITTLFITLTLCLYVILQIINGLVKKDE